MSRVFVFDYSYILPHTFFVGTIGIPDKKVMRPPHEGMSENELVDYSIQRHLAEVAGAHFDLRSGKKGIGLHSFATRRNILDLPPGGKVELFQQPTHSYKYKDFEGTIGPGYGAGKVTMESKGKLLLTSVKPGEIHFTTADNKPENRFALIKTKDNRWLLIKGQGQQPTGIGKEKYPSIAPDKLFEFIKGLGDQDIAQPKIDGALSQLFLKKKPEVFSHRLSAKDGRPIVHTERFFGGRPKLDIPDKLSNMILLGETYGERNGKVIPPQELGGLLNSTIAKSLEDQAKKKVALKMMLFDIARRGNKPSEQSYEDKLKTMHEIAQYLPKDKFTIAPTVKGKSEIQKLMSDILAGKHPMTREGIIVRDSNGRPTKLKAMEEHDVVVRDTFPPKPGSKYYKKGAGGFSYSATAGGTILGRVGSGLSDELRKALYTKPEEYLGRVARIKAQQKLPSGAFRSPSLLAIHEDY